MSSRILKRVLGETSLEQKCRFLFGACLLVLIAASFWWYGRQTEELVYHQRVYQQNRNTGRLLVDHAFLAKHWKSWDEREGKERDRMWVPLIERLSENISQQKYTISFIRPQATDGPHAPHDAFEREVRDRFVKGSPLEKKDDDTPEFADRLSPEGDEYQYYQPIRVRPPLRGIGDSPCFPCHAAPLGGSGIGAGGPSVAFDGSVVSGDLPPPKVGDVIAIAKVAIPNPSDTEALNWNRANLIVTAIITVFLAMVSSYLIIRFVIVRPLRHLRDVSEAISRGNTSMRADIQTGDEFQELSAAFNRMLRHLVTVQDELRQANTNLDGKVDELAQANMRLYELNTIKSDFLATMSHELRTPLNSILGFSDVLGSIDALDDKQKRYVQNIQQSGRTLLEMINDILDLAKMESGKMDVRLTDFHVAQVVAAQCDMARPLAEKKNIDLETSVGPDLPLMRQDQNRVQQILNNLLSNAIKFTPEGGRVTVSVRRDDEDWLVLQVTDTGVGIAVEDQQVIFEKFRQGRVCVPTGDAMTREFSGSGLGLSIVKELCKLLGGSISVASELGKGSTFTVRLPWAVREPARNDSPVVDGFDELTRPRLELARGADL